MRLEVNFSESNNEFAPAFGEVNNISDGGFERGYAQGYDDGYALGDIEGYDRGLAEGYEDGFSEGNTLYYAKNVGSVWENAVFPENHSMILKFQDVPTSLYRAFCFAKNLKSVKIITDDRETPIQFNQTFRECPNIEIVDLTECSRKISFCSYMFYAASNLKRILGALDMSLCTTDTYAFFAGNLQEVEFVPNSIKISFRFSSAYLTDASIESIINGLADLTGSATQTLTLNGVWSKLTAEQRERISAKNWSLAY